MYVEDNAEAILRVLEGGRVGEVYNIGSGRPVANLEVVRRLCGLVAERLGQPREAVRRLIAFVQDRPGHDRLYAMVSGGVRAGLEGSQPATGAGGSRPSAAQAGPGAMGDRGLGR